MRAAGGEVRPALPGRVVSAEDRAYAFLRDAVLTGALAPGERVDLDDLGRVLGLSRMPLRVALRQLVHEGLLVRHPHRRITVAPLSADEVRELYELRILLENHLLELVVPQADRALTDELAVVLAALEETAEAAVRLPLLRRFHAVLYRRAGRPRTLRQLELVQDLQVRYLLLQRVEDHQHHGELLDLVRRRDVGAAQAWVTCHLRTVAATLECALESAPARAQRPPAVREGA